MSAIRIVSLTAAAVLGSAVLAGCGSQSPKATEPVHTTAPAAAAPREVRSTAPKSLKPMTVLMTAPEHLWVQTFHSVYYAGNGLHSFHNVSPQPLKTKHWHILATTFQSGGEAALIASQAGQIDVFHTSDYGGHWLQGPAPVSTGQDILSLRFLSPNMGVIEVGLGVAAGSQAVKIYQTVDGGLHWTLLDKTLGTGTPTPGALPYAGNKTGLTYFTPQDAVATGTEAQVGHIWLYRSVDGGSRYASVPLAVPAADANQVLETLPPEHFGVDSGVMGVKSETSVEIFQTTDAGALWSGSPPLATGNAGTPRIYYATLNTVFVQSAENTGTANPVDYLYRTVNGGHTWQLMNHGSNIGTNLSFANRHDGIMVRNNVVYMTSNGGRSFQKVRAEVR